MSVNTELQALLTKMGGTPLESDSNSDLIKKISNAYEGGGSGGGVTIVNVDESTSRLDMKAGELFTACCNGPVFVHEVAQDGLSSQCDAIVTASVQDGTYEFYAGASTFVAESTDEYPFDTGDK